MQMSCSFHQGKMGQHTQQNSPRLIQVDPEKPQSDFKKQSIVFTLLDVLIVKNKILGILLLLKFNNSQIFTYLSSYIKFYLKHVRRINIGYYHVQNTHL